MEVIKHWLSRVWFRFKWPMLSERDRYGYLWKRTKESHRAVRIYYSYPTVIKVGRNVGK